MIDSIKHAQSLEGQVSLASHCHSWGTGYVAGGSATTTLCRSRELPGRLAGMPLGLHGHCQKGVELHMQLVGTLVFTHRKMCTLIFGLPTLEPVVLGGTSKTTVSFIVSLCRQTDAAAH